MKISLDWLREFVEIAVEPHELKEHLKGLGLGAESALAAGEDWIFDLEITTNRPDCLSHYGVGRELSALYQKPLTRPAVTVKESGTSAASEVSIEIQDPGLCARYCGRVLRNVQVAPSPAGLRNRLEAVGIRSINNVADVTNYVLMELGHPLHAFDLARLRDRKIIVRRARPGERLRTLDGMDRTLGGENLVIADARMPVALAGVMGGKESEISSSTRAVLLESAWFDPLSIRRTSKAHGMHTEASHRFERGADVEMAPVALDRAASLIAELAGGEILQGVLDVYPRPYSRRELGLRSSEIRRILGTDVAAGNVERILGALGFEVRAEGAGGWRVRPPSFRLDVAREVDLIEEIARLYGYDRLPARVRRAPPHPERDAQRDKAARREKELTVSATLISLGYRQIIAPSMVDPGENARFTQRPPVTLLNPLSQEASALRSSPVPGMLRALGWNLDRDQQDLRLFEIGKTYAALPKGPEGLPEERRVLTLGATGRFRWREVGQLRVAQAAAHDRERMLDFFDLKGDLENLCAAFEVPDLRFEPVGCGYYEPGLGGRFLDAGGTLAVFGQLSGEITNEHKLRQKVWLAEVEFGRLLEWPLRTRTFRAYSKFPAVERDFSLILPDEVHYSEVERAVRAWLETEAQSFGSFRQACQPVDLFRGGAVPPGHYSLLLRVTFVRLTHTLTSEEVERLGQGLLQALAPLNVRLRG
jgi:phenylalanyl-tRNA synthetase beta chain